MPTDLPDSLLLELFSPAAAYQDLPGTLDRAAPGEAVDWRRHAEDILDEVDILVEFDGPDQDIDIGVQASLKPKSRDAAVQALSQGGEGWTACVASVREQTQQALLSDLRRVLSPLMLPQGAELRERLPDIPELWLECIANTGDLPAFLDIAAGWPLESWQWFLQNTTPPGPNGTVGLVEALEALSDKTLQKAHAFPLDHAQAWVGWCARSKLWKTTPEVASVALAHELCNPDRGLSAFLAEQGVVLRFEHIRWPSAIRHAQGVRKDRSLEERFIGEFLEAHCTRLAQLFPGHIQSSATPATPSTSAGSIVRLDKPSSLEHMVGVLASPDRRAKLIAELRAAQLAQDTPQAPARKSRLRL